MPVEGNLSDVGTKLLAWFAAGIGTLLAYSAYKNRAPWDVLRDINGPPIRVSTVGGSSSGPSGFYSPGDTSGSFSSSVPRIRMIANREIPPALVDIKPSGKLDKDAAAALARAQAKVGYDFPNTGAYRSYAVQAANFFDNNETLSDGRQRFGDPRKSLHVVGLAIDIHSGHASKPEVVAAMTAEGWQRPRPDAEPWHYSYLVRG